MTLTLTALNTAQWAGDRTVEPAYCGLRLAGDEYLRLPDDGHRYELVHGVMVASPSPRPLHQVVLQELILQLGGYLKNAPVGLMLHDTDTWLGQDAAGEDVIYRPDLVFVPQDAMPSPDEPLQQVPVMVAEVVSPGSRHFDRNTKMADYERFGVQEYWLIDPHLKTVHIYRLQGGSYLEQPADTPTYASQAIPGFTLDLNRLRATFKGW